MLTAMSYFLVGAVAPKAPDHLLLTATVWDGQWWRRRGLLPSPLWGFSGCWGLGRG